MTEKSLFGGKMVHGLDVMRGHDESLRVPGFSTPAGLKRGDLFMQCWDRFFEIRDLSVAAVGKGPPPVLLTPRHAPAVQALHFGGDVVGIRRAFVNILDDGYSNEVLFDAFEHVPLEIVLETAWVGLHAMPFFIDAPMASAVLKMREPDAELLEDLRLPFRSVLAILGAAFELDRDTGWWTDNDVAEAAEKDFAAFDYLENAGVSHRDDAETLYRPSLQSEFLMNGGFIRGAMFIADDEGHLQDHVTWLIQARSDDDPSQGGVAGTVNGKLSLSTMAPLAYNLAALVAWDKWTPPSPDAITGLPSSTKLTGKVRRSLRSASNMGIYVVESRDPRPSSSSHEPTGRTVSPHTRRGHWRSSRVATRDSDGNIIGDVHGERGVDWEYVGHRIQPTLVNASSVDEIPGARVYKIPSRQEMEEDDEP